MIRPVFGKKIEPPVGISEETAQKVEFALYPNPSADELYIRTEEFTKDLSYTISSAEGKLIRSGTIDQMVTELSTSTIQSGLYFVAISKNGKPVSVKKLIVQH